ncbi:MAG TPA: zf-HC2 domain-containing protein [Gemmatimonas sp.]|nr:zf-HC2 domain-containing protein [Gemmatimonas sp.]
MTDNSSNDSFNDGSLPTPECAAFNVALAEYLAGRLDDADAEKVELHAVECARCEVLLERATRRSVASFAPVPADDLRATTLAAIASTTAGAGEPRLREAQTPGVARRWRTGVGVVTLAAAAALVLTVMRREPVAPPGEDERIVQTSERPMLSDVNAVQQGAARLANEGARAEFEALDEAARELERALEAAPGDNELRGYLSSVRSRRGELMERVKMAAM